MRMFNEVSEWKIHIDDLDGELAMTKMKTAKRAVEVISREESLESIEEFYHFIKHGDEAHQSWLKDKFEDWFNLDIK